MTTPLPVLLSRVLAATAAGTSPDRGEPICSLPVWSNVVRCVAAGVATTEAELAPAARISKRMAIAAATGANRRGWLVVGGGAPRGRRPLEATPAGEESDRWWREALAADPPGGAGLRAPLETLVARLPFELPWYPASYGTADPSAIGGSFVPAKPDEGLPAHGQDWSPVLRDAGPLGAVPLTALLSQALVAFAIDYEARPMWPLANTTLVVQHLRTEPVALADLPPDHGIAGNGKSLLERHGLVTAVDKRRAVLTPHGEQVRAHHQPYLDATEAEWRTRYGEGTVADLRAALEGHGAAADPTWPDHAVAPLHLG